MIILRKFQILRQNGNRIIKHHLIIITDDIITLDHTLFNVERY